MKQKSRLMAAALVLVVGAGVAAVVTGAQGRASGPVGVAASAWNEVRAWDARITRMERDGRLELRKEQADTLVPGRKFLRLDQLHRGVPVWEGEAVVETDGQITLSILANLHEGIDVGTDPALSRDAAKGIIERLGGAMLGPDRLPRLVVYPLGNATYRLAYTETVATLKDIRRYFIDANTGQPLDDFSEKLAQSSVGSGTGVQGDAKKISTTLTAGVYVTDDALRPPRLRTYDLKGDADRLITWMNGAGVLSTSDLASDSDNVWTDAAAVDAHVHAGWAYDYFFKRFGRKGLDDTNARVINIVHPVKREDLERYISTGRMDDVQDLFVNAFYTNGGTSGGGIFVYGEGLPDGWTMGGRTVNYFAGALEVVAHEYTHGVADYTCHLARVGESKSLSEAFSDIMGISVDFFFRPSKANYTLGEEAVAGGMRSARNPASLGGVDHYSRKKPTGYEYDNSTIASHAFFLAIEGGTNGTSGRSVQGVGAGSREQIEKAFYRGFTSLTSQATFSMARARTIESARALYGAGSAVERAVTEAWDAVGVF